MTTKIVTAYWMGVNGYPFQGSNDSRKSRYLGSLISHCLGVDLPIICYTHSKNLEELYQLKQEYNLSNLEIKILELTDMRYHKEISKIRDNNFDGNLENINEHISITKTIRNLCKANKMSCKLSSISMQF